MIDQLNQRKHEIGSFVAGYVWTLVILALGANETVQNNVCGIEEISGGLVSLEICNGFLSLLEQVFMSGNALFHISALLTGLVLSFSVYVLKED